jgi:hypothetical protein
VARDPVVEPRLRLAGRPLVNGEAQLYSAVLFSMKVQAPIFREHSASINIHPFGLIVKFVSLHECITRRHAPDATNGPIIL